MSWDLQVGIDNILYSNGIEIYENPPEDSLLPYSTYGVSNTILHDTKTSDGDDTIFTIDVWSQYKNECLNILEEIYLLLRDNEPVMDKFIVDHKRLDTKDLIEDPSGIYHGVFKMRYKLRRVI